MEEEMEKEDFKKLIAEINAGTEKAKEQPKEGEENTYLTYNSTTGKCTLTFNPASLTPEQRTRVAKALAAEALLRPMEAVIGQADLPEGFKVNFNENDYLEDDRSSFVTLYDEINKYRFAAGISGSIAASSGVIGLAFGITAAVVLGAAAAFPPLLLGIIIGCAAVALIGVGATAYFKYKQGKLEGGEEATYFQNEMTKLRKSLEASLEAAAREGLGSEKEKNPKNIVGQDVHTDSPLESPKKLMQQKLEDINISNIEQPVETKVEKEDTKQKKIL